jgi:hypothetical protein
LLSLSLSKIPNKSPAEMNQPDPGKMTHQQKKEVQLQGPRPPPLKVSKESNKIRKPPPHPEYVPVNTEEGRFFVRCALGKKNL